MGTLANNPTDGEDGEYILNEYQDACGGSAIELKENYSLDVVVQFDGPFAFIIHDRTHGRVLAARDADGAQPLYWATCPTSGSLLFASDKALFLDDCENIEEFPRGAVFTSRDGCIEGTTATFGAKVLLHPELCRVESANNISKLMRRTPSLSHIQA
jgi:asparagine synthetase B (glutamine-hydrolysing)